MMPRKRLFANEVYHYLKLCRNDIERWIDICLGLSVNDVYWITPKNFKDTYDQCNLYDHPFSETLAQVAFTGCTNTLKSHARRPELTTDGILPKAWRRMNHKLYLYKGSRNKDISREPYTEFYAAQVASAMKIEHVSYDLVKWKGILASVCENFTTKDIAYVPAGRVLNEYTIAEVVNIMEKLECMDSFKDMILLDAVINNEDRHFGNFGFLKDNRTNEYIKMAPLFDHGLSLFAYLKDEYLLDEESLEKYRLEHDQSAIGAKHDRLVSWFCDKKDVEKLKHLYHFSFQKHEFYNFSDQRLSVLSKYIRIRAVELVEILEGKKIIKENLVQNDEITNIHGDFLGYHYQYVGDDRQGGICTIMNQRNKEVVTMKIKEEDLTTMDAITFIEDKIAEMAQKS